MVGRFLLAKLPSRMSRSASLLGAHASAPAVTHRASEGGITTLHNLFGRASAHPSTPFLNSRGIHASPVSYLSIFRCTRAAYKRSSPPKRGPLVISSSMKPTLVDYVRVKRHFSSSPSAKDTSSWEQYRSARELEWQAQLEAARAASKAECAAWDAEWKAKDAAFNRYVTIIVGSWTVIGLIFVSSSGSKSSRGGTISCKGQICPHCHSRVPQVQLRLFNMLMSNEN